MKFDSGDFHENLPLVLLVAFFWVIPRRLNFIYRRFSANPTYRIFMKFDSGDFHENPPRVLLFAFFLVIPRRLNFICRRFSATPKLSDFNEVW